MKSVDVQKQYPPVRHAEPAPTPLRVRRKAAGMSLERLAVVAGVSASTLRRAEAAPSTLSERTAALVAAVLGCEVADLMVGS